MPLLFLSFLLFYCPLIFDAASYRYLPIIFSITFVALFTVVISHFSLHSRRLFLAVYLRFRDNFFISLFHFAKPFPKAFKVNAKVTFCWEALRRMVNEGCWAERFSPKLPVENDCEESRNARTDKFDTWKNKVAKAQH